MTSLKSWSEWSCFLLVLLCWIHIAIMSSCHWPAENVSRFTRIVVSRPRVLHKLLCVYTHCQFQYRELFNASPYFYEMSGIRVFQLITITSSVSTPFGRKKQKNNNFTSLSCSFLPLMMTWGEEEEGNFFLFTCYGGFVLCLSWVRHIYRKRWRWQQIKGQLQIVVYHYFKCDCGPCSQRTGG